MENFKYTLEKYAGRKTRHTCPGCQHKDVFVKYVDNNGEYLNHDVGRCNRETSCGYHYTPKQYFQDNEKFKDVKPMQTKEPSFIKPEIFKASLRNYNSNNFALFLAEKFGVDAALALIGKYFIGTSKHWSGATVFWQIDTHGKVRTGKIMLYDNHSGKRVKYPYNHITWVHSAINEPEFELKQCLFGEHLLKNDTKTVAIVESEKTAIIASLYLPQFIWLAFGGLTNFNVDKCQPLKGRNVVLFPDIKGFDKWKAKADEMKNIANFTVSDLLERRATEIERLQGLDIADYLLRFEPKDFEKAKPANEVEYSVIEYWNSWPQAKKLFQKDESLQNAFFTEFKTINPSINIDIKDFTDISMN